MKLTFLGANHEVTGSCTLLETGGLHFLIDCGMEQGKNVYENQPLPVAPGEIDGVLLTMVDSRTHNSREISALLRHTYGAKINVFHVEIPRSVRAAEISAEGKSIFAHDPGGKVAEAYKNLTREVIKLEKQREKSRAGLSR